jgi:hypothetical protein
LTNSPFVLKPLLKLVVHSCSSLWRVPGSLIGAHDRLEVIEADATVCESWGTYPLVAIHNFDRKEKQLSWHEEESD